MGKRGEKLLERMRRNSRDWRIEDVQALCDSFDLDFDRPPGGSHYGVSDISQPKHLTIPFARPIKPVSIRRLVQLIDTVREARQERK